MSPEQAAEIRLLTKSNYPTIEQVYSALTRLKDGEGLGTDRDTIFRYFWPLTLTKAFEFLHDEDDARNATLDHMERWMQDIFNYQDDMARLSPFFDIATKRNFIDFVEKLKNNPDVVYGYEEEFTDPETGEDVPPSHAADATFCHGDRVCCGH